MKRNCPSRPLLARSLLALALLAASPALSQGATVSSPVELARAAARLKPGQWVWAPAIAPEGPVLVAVDLSAQTATIYRNGVRIGVSTISSGKAGHETPTGVFTILQKDADHHSSKYNDAPMPYQERLTWDGVALHAGGLPGYPESHGCVHLPLQFSKLLFGTTQMGGTVIISGHAGTPVSGTPAGILDGSASAHQPLAAGEDWRWTPEASPTGPITIILSSTDRRIVVLRNGVEIGRARITLAAGDFGTHVLTFAPTAAEPGRWLFTAVPGHDGEVGKPLDMAVMARVIMPEPFRQALTAAIAPGSTIFVTQSPILPQNSGSALTILASQ